MNRKRLTIIGILCSALVIATMVYVFIQSGVVEGISTEVDVRKAGLEAVKRTVVNIEANFCDRNGEYITKADSPGVSATYLMEPEFSYIIGYRTQKSGDAGLKAKLSDYLYYNDKHGNPCIVTLTTDSKIQKRAYAILAENNYNGAVVVLKNDTGEIIADVSRNGFDFTPSTIDENKAEYDEITGSLMSNSTQAAEYPGSTFKIVMAAAVIENGMEDDLYKGNGVFYIGGGGVPIRNSSSASDYNVTLQESLTNSFNTYFANMALNELGRNKVEDICDRFLIDHPIELDYATLTSSLDVSDESKLAMTGFGQAGVLITPMHLAMIGQTIANDGKMLKPYIIKDITCGKETLMKGKKQVLNNEVISKKTAKVLREHLQTVAEDGYHMDTEGYEFLCAKTGTAEEAGGTYNNLLCCFNENYTVVMVRRLAGNSDYGISLRPHVEEILRLLRE